MPIAAGHDSAHKMSNVVTRRDTCRLCGSRNRELVFPLEPTPSGEDHVTADQLSQPQPEQGG